MRCESDMSNRENETILMVDGDNESNSDDDDDKGSISSESTCRGEINHETLKLHNHIQQQSSELEIWRLFQVDDQNMKEIPNSDAILNMLTAVDFDGK